MKRELLILSIAGLLGFNGQAGLVRLTGDPADYAIAEGTPPTFSGETTTTLRIGANANSPAGGRNAVLMFRLPMLAAGDSLRDAQFRLFVATVVGQPDFNADLWILGVRPDTNKVLDYLESDVGEPDYLKLEDNILGPNTVAGSHVEITNRVGLTAYLQNFYATNAAYAGDGWLFFRLTPDADAGTGNLGWSIGSGENALPPALVLETAADYILTGLDADYAIAEGDPPTRVGTGNTLRIGANANNPPGGRAGVYVFEMPVLPRGQEIEGATLSFLMVGQSGTPVFNADLWGLGVYPSIDPVLFYFEGDTGDPNATKLEDNLLVAGIPDGTGVSSTNQAGLGAYLRDLYAANTNYTGGAYVFLRLTPDADSGVDHNGWNTATTERGNPATLAITVRKTGPQPPNFLIMITDDQRWDAVGVVQRELGASGRFPWYRDQTPGMDRIAAEGLRFRNAFVTLPLCSPSRAAILTGRYNHLNGIIDNQTHFPASAETFATQLRAIGYRTGWFGKWHMSNQTARPGFDDFASFVGQGTYNNATLLVNGVSTSTSGWVDDVSTDYALNFLDANQDRPFAMVVGFKSPHGPFTPAARNAGLFSGEVAGPAPNLNVLAPWRTAPRTYTDEEVRNIFRCVKGVDENVVRLLDRLDVLGLATNTVVIYLSDNGYYLEEHGLGDKRSMYEESMRIPMLVRFPPLIAQPAVRDEMVLNIDIAPTILDLAGAPIPETMQGQTWRPLLQGQTGVSWRTSFLCQYFVEGTYDTPTTFALRTTSAKLILYPGHEEWSELYAVANDQWETNNLYLDPVYRNLRDTLQGQFHQSTLAGGLQNRLLLSAEPGGGVELTIQGGLGPRYQVESSPDLKIWSPVQETKMTTTEAIVSDSGSAAQRFYRTRILADN